MPFLQASEIRDCKKPVFLCDFVATARDGLFFLAENMSKVWLRSDQFYREEEEDEPEPAAGAAAAQRACAAETVGFNAFYGHIYTGAVTELPHI